jgi:hypothetical protein
VRHSLILLALASITASLTAAQSRRPLDGDAQALLAEAQRYASADEGDDAAVRVGLQLPLVSADSVRLATNEALCRRAAAATAST